MGDLRYKEPPKSVQLDRSNTSIIAHKSVTVFSDSSTKLLNCSKCKSYQLQDSYLCALCGSIVCINCKSSDIIVLANKVNVCHDCLKKITNDKINSIQEELDIKNQINLNLKKGLEEQLQIIARCKSFITSIEGSLLQQGLWKNLCELRNEIPISDLFHESEFGVQHWVQTIRTLEKKNLELKVQLQEYQYNIVALEEQVKLLMDDCKSSQGFIESFKQVSFERENFKNVASETANLVEKYKIENESLKIRCFRLEQRVKQLTDNYSNDFDQFPIISFNRSATNDSHIITLSSGLQQSHVVFENTSHVFRNAQLVQCWESFIAFISKICCC
ncbi:hypothetical protein ACR3K2_21620 [Cryptosporidium serpentis]